MKFYLAPLLVAGIMGSAQAKTVKQEVCPTKVSGVISKCRKGKKCNMELKQGDVLTEITYFGSSNCKKKTGFTRVHVESVDSFGIVFGQKGERIPGLKEKFRVDFKPKKQSRRIAQLGIAAKKTKNPKKALLVLKR
jgi:hypothetical protein